MSDNFRDSKRSIKSPPFNRFLSVLRSRDGPTASCPSAALQTPNKMDLQGLIEQMETGEQDTVLTVLQSFNKQVNKHLEREGEGWAPPAAALPPLSCVTTAYPLLFTAGIISNPSLFYTSFNMAIDTVFTCVRLFIC